MTSDEMKQCPDCAESVRLNARVCRHCRYVFADPGSSPTEKLPVATGPVAASDSASTIDGSSVRVASAKTGPIRSDPSSEPLIPRPTAGVAKSDTKLRIIGGVAAVVLVFGGMALVGVMSNMRSESRSDESSNSSATESDYSSDSDDGYVAAEPEPEPEPAPRPAVSAPVVTPDPAPVPTVDNLTVAVNKVRSEGYRADSSSWNDGNTLNVMVGTGSESADGYDQMAFFFVDGKYLGTDLSDPSATIEVVSNDGTTATLRYALYYEDDPYCCPTAGTADVRYFWNGSKLTPLDDIPDLASRR